MSERVLHVPSFGGGVVLEGSTDARAISELAKCSGHDITGRGQLVLTSDTTDYLTANDKQGAPAAMEISYGVAHSYWAGATRFVMVGEGKDVGAAYDFFLSHGAVVAEATPLAAAQVVKIADDGASLSSWGITATFAAFPYIKSGTQWNPMLVNLGSREHRSPRGGPGLYVLYYDGAAFQLQPISQFDALGTGNLGEFAGGTNGKQLYFRGIAKYSAYVFGWGFDDSDTTQGEGRNRLMFCNAANPLKWGNDDVAAAGANRLFSDTDAVTIGAAGESIRACYEWNGRLWIATNRELHWLAGFGRDSFQTDGSKAERRQVNALGPHCLIEGPDGLLYGVGDTGLWQTDGQREEMVGVKLYDAQGKSADYWGNIWGMSSSLFSTLPGGGRYPGKTNADTVWMYSDRDTMQVVTVIPYCSGNSVGVDAYGTLLVKYHTKTGGFTRQYIPNISLTHGSRVGRDNAATPQMLMVSVPPSAGGTTLRRYAYKDRNSYSTADTALPAAAQTVEVEFGPYAPYGPEGVGNCRKVYLTLSWNGAAALPLVFTVTPSVDDQALETVRLTIGTAAPVAPADGDLWVDTSGTEAELGVGVAGALYTAAADYIIKRYLTDFAAWASVAGGGQKANMVTVPIVFTSQRGVRLKLLMSRVTATGRYVIESLALAPAAITEAA